MRFSLFLPWSCMAPVPVACTGLCIVHCIGVFKNIVLCRGRPAPLHCSLGMGMGADVLALLGRRDTPNIQAMLPGASNPTRSSAERRHTIAIVAHYDSIGVAPRLATGTDSNGSAAPGRLGHWPTHSR